ncbi:hypothetical protein F5B20DRAFT_559613 [Whalleya microplaca]|nr:hypothetical protein F5B20DRAFT_559613 [Whalleya microplaca]
MAFTLGAASVGSVGYVALAAYPIDGNISRSNYASLHKIQCQVFFDPYEFLVAVNTTSRSIAVVPQTPAPAFDSNTALAENTINRLNSLASIVITTQWTSLLGDLFQNNVQNVARLKGSSNATTFEGVGTAIESMLDNILQATSAAQLVVLNDTQTSTAEIRSLSFMLGNPMYTYGILSLNIFATLIYIIEFIRTRVWRGAPRFDFMDIKAVILNALVPGNDIVKQASNLDDSVLGSTQVTLARSQDGTLLSSLNGSTEQSSTIRLFNKIRRSKSTSSTSASITPSISERNHGQDLIPHLVDSHAQAFRQSSTQYTRSSLTLNQRHSC